jgi:hypothetical protein
LSFFSLHNKSSWRQFVLRLWCVCMQVCDSFKRALNILI